MSSNVDAFESKDGETPFWFFKRLIGIAQEAGHPVNGLMEGVFVTASEDANPEDLLIIFSLRKRIEDAKSKGMEV